MRSSASGSKSALADRLPTAEKVRAKLPRDGRARRPANTGRGTSAASHKRGPMSSNRSTVLVDLALQGGGSHGAFTWGVLDRLLEEPWLQIEGISGTSAGAMNAAVLADGWTEGGATGARAALDAFWRARRRRRALQPVPAHAARQAARALDARLLAGVRRARPDVARCSRPTISIRAASIRWRPSWPRASTSSGCRSRRSSSSSPRPTCAPAAAACSATPS